jgi:hypothetical protein
MPCEWPHALFRFASHFASNCGCAAALLRCAPPAARCIARALHRVAAAWCVSAAGLNCTALLKAMVSVTHSLQVGQ